MYTFPMHSSCVNSPDCDTKDGTWVNPPEKKCAGSPSLGCRFYAEFSLGYHLKQTNARSPSSTLTNNFLERTVVFRGDLGFI